MKLQRVSIKNFKSIPPTGIEIAFRKGLLALVGKNNAGKSNIIEATSLLFGTKNPRYVLFPIESFNDPTQPIVLEAEFTGLSWGDGKSLGFSDPQCGSLMHEGKRVETEPGHVTFRLTVPPVGGNEDENDAENEDGEEPDVPKRTFEVFLAKRHELKRNEQFRLALLKYMYVPPVRSASDLLAPSTWTSYGRMVQSILAESDQLDKLRELIVEATDRLRLVLQSEAKTLTESAKTTAYVDSIDFRLTKDGNPSELLRNLSLAVTYGNRTEDISNSGTGTQSAVIIGVLELCLRHRAKAGVRLFAVEEPELFLHPHAQRHVASLLRKIANEPSTQVILTTHSASILAQTDMLDVIRVDRDERGGTRCCRLTASYDGLDAWERTLTGDFAEMFFADRVVLVEGPSETIILPRIARATDGAGGGAIDPDRYNVSFVNVGGKDKFHIFTSLLDEMHIEWRVVADKDALAGETLAEYKKQAGITAGTGDLDQCRNLLKVGVAVLTKGEIEDYFPIECLAEIAGCSQQEAQDAIARRRTEFEEPTAMQLVQTVILENKQAICESNEARLPKLIQRWYSQSVQRLREGGAVGQVERKTGDVLTLWLKMGKPEIAQRVSKWMLNTPGRIPTDLQRLVKWLVLGGHTSSQPAPSGDGKREGTP